MSYADDPDSNHVFFWIISGQEVQIQFLIDPTMAVLFQVIGSEALRKIPQKSTGPEHSRHDCVQR
jgi:hypothetical protein